MGAKAGIGVLERLCSMLGRKQRERIEIPRDFVSIPVELSKLDSSILDS